MRLEILRLSEKAKFLSIPQTLRHESYSRIQYAKLRIVACHRSLLPTPTSFVPYQPPNKYGIGIHNVSRLAYTLRNSFRFDISSMPLSNKLCRPKNSELASFSHRLSVYSLSVKLKGIPIFVVFSLVLF